MTEPWGAPQGPSEPRPQGGRPYGRQQEPEPGPYADQGYYGQQPRPYAPPYADQDFYAQRPPMRPPTSYLDRDLYKELSENNLDQEAYSRPYERSGSYEQPRPYERSGQSGTYGNGSRDQRSGQRPSSSHSTRSRRPPVKQSNGVAVAGALLFFVPLLGLILSIVGRAKASARGGVGRTAGTVGIVLSLLFTGGVAFAAYKIHGSTAADPACLSAEAVLVQVASTMGTDEASVNAAETSGDKAKFATADTKFVGDVQKLKSQLDAAAAKATHSSVRTALQNFDADLAAIDTGMGQLLHGDTSNESATDKAVDRLDGDGDAIDGLCGDITNG